LLNRRKLLSNPKKLGRWGERYSEKFLKRKGLKLLARNFSSRDGEIDLVMVDRDSSVVFIEVKTRADEQFDSAESAINYSKKNKLVRTAKLFCRKYGIENRALRFDAVIVVVGESAKPQVRHYQNIY
jgi:putative endonuclease